MRQNYKVSEQSKSSFKALNESGKVGLYKSRILANLSKAPATRRKLTKLCDARHPSNLCASLKQLENQGLIKVVGFVRDEVTGREVSLYGLSDAANCLYINSNSSNYVLHGGGLDNPENSAL